MDNKKNTYSLKKLDTATLTLSGRHLIEASAGTGKTYNITRLYLRLLLEKDLTVQQILVMTFTKAATEELRGRIDNELRNAISNWGSLGETDPFYKVMEATFNKQQAIQKLKLALLELDEASIFTIHGFCSRALSSQAFSSGLSLEVSMESDCSELLLESIRDWLRKIAQNTADFKLLEENNWHIPEQFLSTFYRAISASENLHAIEEVSLSSTFLADFQQQKIKYLSILKDNESNIFAEFINGHTASEVLNKAWPLLILWLEDKNIRACSALEGDFLKQGRFSKKSYVEIKQLLRQVYEFKQNYNKALNAHNEELKKYHNALRSKLIVQGIKIIREKFVTAKEQLAIMDFDDLISYLSQKLQSADGQDLANRLRKQYPVALVDEFQDTDPNQYAILDCLYAKSIEHSGLFMIGDPKQAIYAFRGGDIFTYLSAREAADYHWYMDTNWRSVAGVVSGYNRLFLGEPLDQQSISEVFAYNISYEKIKATDKAVAAKYTFDDPDKQFSAINYCYLSDVAKPSGAKGDATGDDLKQGLANWCAIEISRLLSIVNLNSICDNDQIGKPVQEKDIAILVRTSAEAQIIRDTLSHSNFPSVYLSGKENIFKSQQAEELLHVLKGVLECENNTLLTSALSTYLMAGNAEKLALYHEQDSEQAWEIEREQAVLLRSIWVEKGCMTMLIKLIADDYQPEPSQHERSLTNMIHLAELLQQASRQYKHPQQLLKWFSAQCRADNMLDEAQLRLESDANLIRIVTQHGSKGLEYPIVFIPFASVYNDPVRFGNTLQEYYEYHDAKTYQPKCQIGQSEEAIELATAEGHAETIRLLYVAITRATHRCYLGVAPFKKSAMSSLGLTIKLSADNAWQESLEQLVDSSEKSSSLIIIQDDQDSILARHAHTDQNKQLSISKLNHTIDDQWSLNSFSSLMRESYVIRQEQKDRSDDDAEINNHKTAVNLLRFSLRKGADTGNLLHDIFEHTNFSDTTDWPIETPLRRFGGLDELEQSQLISWLEDCLQTTLPSITPESVAFKLADLAWSQTLRESEFYFPMHEMQIDSLSACLQIHRGDTQTINLPEKKQLEGMMCGFIDLIFEHNGSFYMADYKSTHLGDQFKNYDWQALKNNNQQHFYDLQYLIYSLALHRYLKTRIADYDHGLHFGGVYYLYLRGMSAENLQHYGIFHTAIELTLLEKLDKVFQGEIIQEAMT